MADAQHPGKLAFFNRSRVGVVSGTPTMTSGTSSSVIGGVDWRNVLIVDPDGGGDHTTIQAAIDAATAPGATNQWLVWIAPGNYNETPVLVSFVHLRGMVRDAVRIVLQSNMASVDNCDISDLTIDHNSTKDFTGSHAQFTAHNVYFNGSNSNDNVTLSNGRYYACRFENVSLALSGSGESAQPQLFDCTHEASVSAVPAVSGSRGKWHGGSMFGNGAGGDIYLTVTTGVEIIGAKIFVNAGMFVTTSAKFVGCDILNDWGGAITSGQLIKVDAGARFIGCRMAIVEGSSFGANPAYIQIRNLSGDEIVFEGCEIQSNDGPLFQFSGLTDANMFPLRISGSSLRSHDSPFGVHSSGFSGNVLVYLDKNHYTGATGSSSVLPQPIGGGKIRWSGSDLHAVFVPVAVGRGTGATQDIDFKTVQELNLATETAFVTGRIPAPTSIIAEILLMLSAAHTGAEVTDTFTAVNGTALSAHTADTGETWTNQSGGTTIQSNQASGEGINTISVAAANGYVSLAAIGGNNATEGIVFRWADISNHWRFVRNNLTFQLVKAVAGPETIVASVSGSGGAPVSVSFHGSTIRCWINGQLRIEVTDTALQANTGVGLYLAQPSTNTPTADGFSFYPGGTVDLTVATRHGQEGERYDAGGSTAPTGVPVIHHAYTLQDVTAAFSSPFSEGLQEQLWGMRITLDALSASITALYVHGILVRVLGSATTAGALGTTPVPREGLSYR